MAAIETLMIKVSRDEEVDGSMGQYYASITRQPRKRAFSNVMFSGTRARPCATRTTTACPVAGRGALGLRPVPSVSPLWDAAAAGMLAFTKLIQTGYFVNEES